MKVDLIKKTTLTTICLLLLIQSCSGFSNDTANKKTPVSWSSGFILPELLASPLTLNTIDNIPDLIQSQWYTGLTVKNSLNGDTTLFSCSDFFERASDLTAPVNEYEINYYLEFKIMCEAARYLMTAQPSEWSYLPNNPINSTSPQLWPKAIALQTSTAEYNRSLHDPSLKHWNDITPIINFESISDGDAIYHFEGGNQHVQIVGRGDTNNDGIEDLIIVIRESLLGGNYFNIRLLILSVDEKNNWYLIEEL